MKKSFTQTQWRTSLKRNEELHSNVMKKNFTQTQWSRTSLKHNEELRSKTMKKNFTHTMKKNFTQRQWRTSPKHNEEELHSNTMKKNFTQTQWRKTSLKRKTWRRHLRGCHSSFVLCGRLSCSDSWELVAVVPWFSGESQWRRARALPLERQG